MTQLRFLFLFLISTLSFSQEVVVDFGYPEKVSGFQNLTPIFSIDKLNAGSYWLRFIKGDHVITRKIVKQ